MLHGCAWTVKIMYAHCCFICNNNTMKDGKLCHLKKLLTTHAKLLLSKARKNPLNINNLLYFVYSKI